MPVFQGQELGGEERKEIQDANGRNSRQLEITEGETKKLEYSN